MNSRIFKKQCRRAVPYLLELFPAAFDSESHFKAGCAGNDSPSHQARFGRWDEKHYERLNGKPFRSISRSFVYVRVLDGTDFFGGVSGYYEPEWWDAPAIDLLIEQMVNHWRIVKDPDFEFAYIGPKFRTWKEIFMAAEQMKAEMKLSKGGAA